MGNEAAQAAGMPYYRAAGEKMLEAKAQLKHGEFGPWIKRKFSISDRQARTYMALAKTEVHFRFESRFYSPTFNADQQAKPNQCADRY
jgi:Protein of unknown function (DUF3102)